MRILVIEDDRDAASWLIKGLTESGHVIDHAANGEDGLAMAQENLHDILIVDRMLPKMDGLAVCKELREKVGYLPILMLTAKDDVVDKVLGLEMGARQRP